ncbi:hypothetical protein GDI0895 [Gluconacetobacter diazotrophicus PA1 5]|uniref:Uncharacterized protein n=1 Tax=Gluconacetobacter diazotrophicus (strain ATCC 49037 / DSM 5601 / CCUG 37298 / CIP 103539 / LMG 7603 / PAl5) TaxID=272568 RepID=A9HBN9_GLUDA|nr:hypothetical protein GDI0895 [Gluconacetobacter diazotrophicus PA1 5]
MEAGPLARPAASERRGYRTVPGEMSWSRTMAPHHGLAAAVCYKGPSPGQE